VQENGTTTTAVIWWLNKSYKRRLLPINLYGQQKTHVNGLSPNMGGEIYLPNRAYCYFYCGCFVPATDWPNGQIFYPP
jgi:hypothetical protein